MTRSTRFTDLVRGALPGQPAAMGGVGTTELAAAVIGLLRGAYLVRVR